MSDDKDNLDTEQQSSDELLDELGSLKELLNKEPDNAAHYTTVEEISSVEDYLRIKQQAAEAELSIEEYLSQQATSQTDSEEVELFEIVEEEETISSSDKISENSIPVLDEVVTSEDAIPVLEEVANEDSEAPENTLSLEDIQELVSLIVERKLQHLKPELEQQTLKELKKLLPLLL